MSNILSVGNQTPYNVQANIYTKFESIIPQKKITGFMFTNIGDTIAFVNNMILNPDPRNVVNPALTFIGDSRSILLHANDVYIGNIDLSFDAAAPGTNPKVEIVQIFYMADNKV